MKSQEIPVNFEFLKSSSAISVKHFALFVLTASYHLGLEKAFEHSFSRKLNT